jgi:hypothetical protein
VEAAVRAGRRLAEPQPMIVVLVRIRASSSMTLPGFGEHPIRTASDVPVSSRAWSVPASPAGREQIGQFIAEACHAREGSPARSGPRARRVWAWSCLHTRSTTPPRPRLSDSTPWCRELANVPEGRGT